MAPLGPFVFQSGRRPLKTPPNRIYYCAGLLMEPVFALFIGAGRLFQTSKDAGRMRCLLPLCVGAEKAWRDDCAPSGFEPAPTALDVAAAASRRCFFREEDEFRKNYAGIGSVSVASGKKAPIKARQLDSERKRGAGHAQLKESVGSIWFLRWVRTKQRLLLDLRLRNLILIGVYGLGFRKLVHHRTLCEIHAGTFKE